MIAAGFPYSAHPFPPVGARFHALPRILFVGQATKGYNGPEQDTFAKAVATNIDLLTTVRRQSPFQRFCKEVASGLLQGLGLRHGERAVLQSIGWSNLAKIGHAGDINPTTAMISHQATLSAETLRTEIKNWKPHAVVLVTSAFAQNEILLPTFGRDKWTTNPNTIHVEYKSERTTHCPLVWTLYPRRRQPRIEYELVRESTISQLVDLLKPWKPTRRGPHRVSLRAARRSLKPKRRH
jgi:hypothetical protein